MEKNEYLNQGKQQPVSRFSWLLITTILLLVMATLLSGCDLVDGLSNLAGNIGDMLQGALK